MPPAMGDLINGILKLTLATFGLLYVGLVVMGYRADGLRARPRLHSREFAASAKHLLVWLGANALGMIIRISVMLWDMLSEASAEVGEWFLRRGSPGLRQSFRSRFTI